MPEPKAPKTVEVGAPISFRGEAALVWPKLNPAGARLGTALPNKFGMVATADEGFTPLVCSFNGFRPSSVGMVCSWVGLGSSKTNGFLGAGAGAVVGTAGLFVRSVGTVSVSFGVGGILAAFSASTYEQLS